MDSPAYALAQQFHLTELQAMWLAGEVGCTGVPTYPIYIPLGATTTVSDRARSLQSLCTPGRVITGTAAAWIWAGGSPPQHVEVLRHSSRSLIAPNVVFVRGTLTSSDITQIEGCRLSTAVATLRALRARGEAIFSHRLAMRLGATSPADVRE